MKKLFTICILLIASFSLLAQIPANGLVGYWPFNGNANDESGNGNDGVVNGAALTSDRFGNGNSAYSFNGVNNFIEASANPLPQAERTISFWYNTINPNNVTFLSYGGGVCGTSWILLMNSQQCGPNGINAFLYSSHCCIDTFTLAYQNDQVVGWHHVAFTSSSSGSKLYLDSEIVFSNDTFINNTNTNNKDFFIGAEIDQDGEGILPNANFYNGKLDDIRIYNRELSQSEITALFNENQSWSCGNAITINHIAGDVAPVNKTVTYGTVTNIPGENSKCWITSNLGADHQATSVDDATEASAGWYWQFNRMQGYKHDGVTRTPNITWYFPLEEDLDWQAANDPCTLELGIGWSIPTYSEWNNVDVSGGWIDCNGPWNSALKLHAAGYLLNSDGSLAYRGLYGTYWSSSQFSNSYSWYLNFISGSCYMTNSHKALGFTTRCIRAEAPTWSCGDSINYDGQVYSTVPIGAQCWMAENLNVGTRINGGLEQTNNGVLEKYCYNDNESNCNIYGGLYHWAEMVQYMNGATDTTSWNPVPLVAVQGICPEGWHIPTDAEWCEMETYLNAILFCDSVGWHGNDVGGKMKETGIVHWASPNNSATNSSGFTALPGGNYGYNGPDFYNLNYDAYFWTASEFVPQESWFRDLHYNYKNEYRFYTYKEYGLSVRCLKDESTNSLNSDFSATPLEGVAPLNVQFTDESTGNPSVWIWDFQNDGINDAFIQNPTFTYEEPGEYSVKLIVVNATDADTTVKTNYIIVNPVLDCGDIEYEGQVYSSVQIGEQCWMSENLNVGTKINSSQNQMNNSVIEKYCYNNLESNCDIYGGLYQWNEIMQYNDNEGAQGICPEGWHISTDSEWSELTTYLGGETVAGGEMKEAGTSHWAPPNTGATNSSGFTALPGGHRPIDGSFERLSLTGYFWSSTKYDENYSWKRDLDNGGAQVDRYYHLFDNNDGISVRCLKDKSTILIPEICIVSVTPDEHNKVIWEKQQSEEISTFNIYRETTQTNVYEVIGSMPYADSSIFVDMTSNPQQRPYKYKISAVSTSGTETVLSNYHRTIHLTINEGPTGWNLIWSPYEGFPFNTYYIYRGTTQNSLTLFDSISGSFTSYTDINPPWGPLYYAIEIVNEAGCYPSRDDGYSRSRSNVQFNGVVGIVYNPEAGVKIYPNPANDVLNIQFDDNDVNAELVIYDIQGKAMISKQIQQEKTNINIGNLNPGVYIIRVEYDQNLLTRKLIVY